MTTEDLIELLKQHPKERVGVAVHTGRDMAWCAIEGVRMTCSTQPRLMVHVQCAVKLDESAVYEAIAAAVMVAGHHGSTSS